MFLGALWAVAGVPGQAGAAANEIVQGDSSTLEYHLSGCPGYGKVPEDDQVLFLGAQAAELAGYNLAPSCRGVASGTSGTTTLPRTSDLDLSPSLGSGTRDRTFQSSTIGGDRTTSTGGQSDTSRSTATTTAPAREVVREPTRRSTSASLSPPPASDGSHVDCATVPIRFDHPDFNAPPINCSSFTAGDRVLGFSYVRLGDDRMAEIWAFFSYGEPPRALTRLSDERFRELVLEEEREQTDGLQPELGDVRRRNDTRLIRFSSRNRAGDRWTGFAHVDESDPVEGGFRKRQLVIFRQGGRITFTTDSIERIVAYVSSPAAVVRE